MDFITAISRLWSFDHPACDSALRRAHIDVWGVKLVDGTAADLSIYAGSAFVVFWLTMVTWGSIELWTGRKTISGRDGTGRASLGAKLLAIVGPALGVAFCFFQVRAVTNYVEACRAILHLQ